MASLTRADIVAALARERDLETGSAPWTLRFIERASAQFREWREVELDAAAALDIILPPHNGEPCKGDRLELVPSGGATVADATNRLRAIRSDYEQNNPTCWGRIAEASARPFSTLILTTAPLDADEYRSLTAEPGRLYHLDGFHRLIGWALVNRLTTGTRVRALMAQ